MLHTTSDGTNDSNVVCAILSYQCVQRLTEFPCFAGGYCNKTPEFHRVFHKKLYNFESICKFIQRTCAMF
jgi:hypothetical protein